MNRRNILTPSAVALSLALAVAPGCGQTDAENVRAKGNLRLILAQAQTFSDACRAAMTEEPTQSLTTTLKAEHYGNELDDKFIVTKEILDSKNRPMSKTTCFCTADKPTTTNPVARCTAQKTQIGMPYSEIALTMDSSFKQSYAGFYTYDSIPKFSGVITSADGDCIVRDQQLPGEVGFWKTDKQKAPDSRHSSITCLDVRQAVATAIKTARVALEAFYKGRNQPSTPPPSL